KISGTSGGNYEALDTTDTTTVTVKDDSDPVEVTIEAVVTTPKVIDVNTKTDGTTGVTIKAYGSNGEETELTTITGTNHDGFGVETKVNGKSVNNSNGDTKELGVGEKIVVEFTDKDVNSLDVSFAWRNNHETAKLTFINDGKIVGYATVTGDGSSTTKAIVTYYDENEEILKVVNAKGSSDKVDELFTFELPDSNGGIVSFDTVEFSAPKTVDDYLINSIVYKEVVNTSITDVLTDGGKVTFNIQVDENYPPQGKATAIVEVNGKEYEVSLNATGRGTLELSSSDLGTDLSNVEVKVVRIEGGNYESVNSTTAEFDFTTSGTGDNLSSSNDNINTYEDTAYILKVTDFGEYGEKVQEFKITELPTNGKLYLTVTTGETIIDKDGNKTIATEDTKVEISKDQIISLADIAAGKVVFEPNENSDKNGSFEFQAGDGNGNFSDSSYTTTIDVKAVADAPEVTISITPSTDNPSSDGSNNQNGGTSNSGNNSSDWWEGYSSKDDIIDTTSNYTKTNNYNNWNNYTNNSDSIEINGNQNQWISTENGDDNVYIAKNSNEGMNTGAGDDRVFIQGNSTSEITLDSGNDELHIIGNASTISAGDGNDKILIEGEATNNINLGSGSDELHIIGNASTISAGDGNDKIRIDGNAKGTIELGNGNNYLEIKGNASSIQVSQNSGNDRVIVSGNATNNISLGAGDDYLELDGKIQKYVDGGAGNNDSVYLKGYTLSEYQSLIANGNELRVQNFENIKLGDGTIVKGDGSVFADTTTVYKYDISLSAQLTDKDESESLSKDENGNEIITLKNIPEDSKLYGSDGNEINANDDGSYTVKVGEDGKAELTLTNENEVSDTDLNSIKASATSNEVNENDSATSTSTVDNILSTDINFDKLSSIISENGEINLANSKAENISLTLDDVIKLSGDDNVIKISGDNFDSVTFKDTVGENGQENNWSKVAGTDTDQGYDIYTNSGDPTIQVKVEQPISDGITN
ncbi:hypothetical protein N5915_11500, partial [Arcobacter lacus]|uniref:hypothetical protein n=1 Tax=Arcobacter lacus TaxID=1912876 RepID=UPI0021BB8160